MKQFSRSTSRPAVSRKQVRAWLDVTAGCSGSLATHQVVETLCAALGAVLRARKDPKETVYRRHRCRSDRCYPVWHKTRLREASSQGGRIGNGARRSHKLVQRKGSRPRRQESIPYVADASPALVVGGSASQPSRTSEERKRSLATFLAAILAAFVGSRV
jgi:hypothetical protein